MKFEFKAAAIVIAVVIAWVSYIYNPGPAPKIFIESQGYTEVEVGTLTYFGCNRETGYSFKAKKDNVNVSGAVCNSFMIFGTNVIRLN